MTSGELLNSFIFRCLTETFFVCRSATFDAVGMNCHLVRRTIGEAAEAAVEVEESSNFDYLENECLTGKEKLVQTKAKSYRSI
jgi:hypothetical protein